MALGLAAVMASATLAGCGGNKTSSETTQGNNSSLTATTETTDNKLVVAIQTNSYVTDYDNN